jgi:hypothetical protein
MLLPGTIAPIAPSLALWPSATALGRLFAFGRRGWLRSIRI